MSSNSNFINDSDTNVWTTVRTKKFIEKCNSRTGSPVLQDTIVDSKSDVIEKSVIVEKPILVEKPIVVEKPIIVEKPTVHDSMIAKESSVTDTHSIKIPLAIPQSTPNTQNIPLTGNVQDWWSNMLEVSKINKTILDNQINYLTQEIQFPLWLRGKSLFEKDNLVKENIYNLVGNMINNIKDELISANKFVDTINPRKITGMIIENNNLYENMKILYNSEELLNNVKESCEILYHESVKCQTKINIDNTDISLTKEKEQTVENKSEKQFSYDERVEHKKALLTAQEKFFEMCVLSDENVLAFKENISPIKDWSGIVNTIHISNDEIKVDKYSFSKKHFLKNTWFRNRLMEKYIKLFGFESADIILPKANSNVLIIEGTVKS